MDFEIDEREVGPVVFCVVASIFCSLPRPLLSRVKLKSPIVIACNYGLFLYDSL